jgi:ABC-type transport auxiliary lipoprotein component
MHREAAVRAVPCGMPTLCLVILVALASCCAMLLLSSCQDVGYDASGPPRMAPGVSIAIDAIEGPPEAVQNAFSAALSQAAASHQVTVVDDSQGPRYRLKGYLTASSTSDGKTMLAYVWDVFDAKNRRAQRVAGAEPAAGDPADLWAQIDDKILQRVAAKSMDGIADFLANASGAAPAVATTQLTPRQVTERPASGAVAGASVRPLGYAAAAE